MGEVRSPASHPGEIVRALEARVAGLERRLAHLDPIARTDTDTDGWNGYEVQMGSRSVHLPANSEVDVNETGLGWASEHVFFVGFIWPTASWHGVDNVASQPNGLDAGAIHVKNGNTAQWFTFRWLSVGR